MSYSIIHDGWVFWPGKRGDGFWYGYATPEDAAPILESHVNKGQPVAKLWRGQLGMGKEEHSAQAQVPYTLHNNKTCTQANLSTFTVTAVRLFINNVMMLSIPTLFIHIYSSTYIPTIPIPFP